MSDYDSLYLYFGFIALVTLLVVSLSALFPARKNKVKSMPYESGMLTQTHLLQERFPLQHYLVGLIFLILDVEVVFLYPWAVVGKSIGSFAFWEMAFFLVALLVGFTYVWKKGGLKWE